MKPLYYHREKDYAWSPPIKSHEPNGFYKSVSVAGLRHYELNYEQYLDEEESILSAVYEPTNQYDKNAIAIYGGKHLIGYMPKEIAEEIADMPKRFKSRLAIREINRFEMACRFELFFVDINEAETEDESKEIKRMLIKDQLEAESSSSAISVSILLFTFFLFVSIIIFAVSNAIK